MVHIVSSLNLDHKLFTAITDDQLSEIMSLLQCLTNTDQSVFIPGAGAVFRSVPVEMMPPIVVILKCSEADLLWTRFSFKLNPSFHGVLTFKGDTAGPRSRSVDKDGADGEDGFRADL